MAARKSLRYLDGLQLVSRRLAAIEAFPYHSQVGPGRLETLPSSQAARAFAHEVLLPRAHAGNATVIATRAAGVWALSPEDDNGETVIVYQGGETRSAYLTPRSRGGAAILRALSR